MPWYEQLMVAAGTVGFMWGFANLFAMLQLSRKAERYHICQECADQGLVPSWRVFAMCRNCDTKEKRERLFDERDRRLNTAPTALRSRSAILNLDPTDLQEYWLKYRR